MSGSERGDKQRRGWFRWQEEREEESRIFFDLIDREFEKFQEYYFGDTRDEVERTRALLDISKNWKILGLG